ncbi:YncE family protein [Clostridium pasteurianum]|uniref:YncE family protein n=1 Tax=Clostridium pasteurianum TaxID=1501 RepID=UPI001FA7A467|nr:YncE family protein [Clostridium pasteurianum]
MCNSGSDDVSVIDLNSLSECSRINLRIQMDRIGPHGICRYKDNIITANMFSNTISIINFERREIYKSLFIGMHCNDLKVFNERAYVVCGDSNSIVKYNIKNESVEEIIPCGCMPHSIDFNVKNNTFVTADMEDSTITIFKDDDYGYVKRVKVGEYPTKALFTEDGKKIIVCESNMGTDSNGTLSIIPLNNTEKRLSIKVGKWPVDVFYENGVCFVSNLGEGSISIVRLDRIKESKKIYIGGMPRGILKRNEILYVDDSYNNSLICIDMKLDKTKIIPIGNEPTGIIFI